MSLDIGDLSVTTFALPVVYRFNSGGDLRPLLYLGPAYVIYDINRKSQSGVVPLFTTTCTPPWGSRIGSDYSSSELRSSMSLSSGTP